MDLEIGDVASWSHIDNVAPAIVESEVLSFITAELLLAPDAARLAHIDLYNVTGSTTELEANTDYRLYEYVTVKDAGGTVYEIGVPWINESTIVKEAGSTLVIEISDFDGKRMDAITRMLFNNGFDKYTTKIR